MDRFSSLLDLILSLEQGTKLHISVLFFVPVGETLQVDFPHTVHSSPFCNSAKQRPRGLVRCMRCKKYATEKARRTGRPFAGICINGIYECCLPVTVEGEVICVLFVGNAVLDYGVFQSKNAPWAVDDLRPSLEESVSPEECRRIADVVGSYVRLLYSFASPPTQTETSGLLVRNLIEYADSHFYYDICLSQLSEIFHYNEKYIGRMFKQTTGMSFRRYVNGKRLSHAKNLLQNTSQSVLEVALASGFNNVTYFNRLFKEVFGVTPSQLRAGSDTPQNRERLSSS